MSELSSGDLQLIVSRLPRDVVKLMKERRIFLGGGFVRATIAGEKPSDIDLFGETKDQLEIAARILKDERHGSRFHASKNAFTVLSGVRMPVQFIHRWLFTTPQQCLDSFDFTVAQGIIWFADEAWHSACHPTFYQDLAARRLVYCAPQRNEDAGGSLLRVRKFLARGYNIQAPSLAAAIARLCSSVDFTELRSETQVAEALRELLYEVDPLIMIDGLDLVNEHEVQ